MADDVPVYDVLSEAMEYLCKLGANLRVRSENLRAKKIRRDKLKNAHAVQKAANKVLLICELSKKSLINVESGVKKVLSHIEAAQASSAAISTKKFHYFVYESRKLKIAKKIPLKHFLSVKVQARGMPTSLQDKYPVYHNCKLYRSRKRIGKNEEDSFKNNINKEYQKENIVGNDHIQGTESLEMENVASDMKKMNDLYSEKRNVGIQIENDSDHSSLPDSESSTGKRKIQRRTSKFCQKEKKKKALSIDTSDEDATQKESENNFSKGNTNLDVTRDKTRVIDTSDEDATQKESENILSKENITLDVTRDKARVIDTSDKDATEKESENILSKENTTLNVTRDKARVIKTSDEDATQKESENILSKENFKLDVTREKARVIHTSDEDTTQIESENVLSKGNTTLDVTSDNERNDSHATHKLKRRKLSESHIELDDKENQNSNPAQSECQSDNRDQPNHSTDSDMAKPVIKCVSINKLLKPDILEKFGEKSFADKIEKASKPLKTYTRNKHNDKKKNERIKPAIPQRNVLNSEDEFWHNKRKEVEAFKPKNFIICVSKLPKLSVNFLLKHNLKRIVQNDSVVCEVVDETTNLASNNKLPQDCTNKDQNINEPASSDIDKVKNALLNDSDSDASKNPHNLKGTDQLDKIKNALLNESDSDINSNNDSSVSAASIPACIANKHKEKESCLKKNIDNAHESNDTLNSDTNKKCNDQHDKSDSSSSRRQNVFKKKKKYVIKVKLPLKEKKKKNRKSGLENDNERNVANDKDKTEEYDRNEKIAHEDDSGKNVEVSGENQKKADRDEHKDNNHLDDNGTHIEQTDKSMSEGNENNHKNPSHNNDIRLEKTYNSVSDADENTKKVDESDTIKTQKSPKNTDEIKKALLNSSDDHQSKTPHKQKKQDSATPRSKRKHIMESMHAKKMLLTYSSSSETEDEQLRGVLKQIKDSLLKGVISDDEQKQNTASHRRKLMISSESDESSKKAKFSTNRTSSTIDRSSKEKSEIESTKSGTANAVDTQSNSSRSKMGRTKTNSTGRSSSCSSDSQDSRDKDIDGLTNLKTLIKARRRRTSPSTVSKSSRSTRRRTRRMSKPPLISAENMLQAESSSDVPSGAESETGEDLPNITLPNINGSTMTHLAKDDLLEESDSSSSKENDTEDTKKEDSDDNVKSKRRKAVVAISSDSEAGSSRKKGAAVKMSDFEDSETESSEPAHKAKRKKKASDSDCSVGSSKEGGQKKRRRIKPVNDSDDVSGSDTENEGKKHGRKNIRKVMGKNQLEEATKKAAREEKERMARIAERQKLYNNLEFDESGKPDEVVLEKVVLDFDPETKEPLIEVDRGLVKKLKPHQANGIKFMWDACFESVKRIKKDKGSGCILAHCMGLGKTLQVVSLTHTLLTHSSLTGVNRVLVVCPLSTVLNWVNEFRMWLKHAETEFEVDVYELSRYKQNSERAFQLQQWFGSGGVCVLGYEMFRNLSADNSKKFKKKMLRNFQESLVDPGPDLVVCDEGHLLKNEKTSLSQSMNRVKTYRRIVLTGTPLQNNLKEYYCMVQFVKPNLLGKYNEYLNRFVNPITNGQYTDSTEHDIRIMKRRSHVLHKMLDGAVQRRDYGVLAPFLPPKHEYVLFITLTDVQVKLYQFYLDNYSRRPLPGKSSGFLFPDFQSLQRIWTHPLVLKYNSERYEIMQQKKREREEEDSEGSLVDFIDDDSTPDETSTEETSDDSSDMSDDSRKKSKKKKSGKKGKGKDGKAQRRGTRANPVELEEDKAADPDIMEVKNENPTEWWIKLVEEEELEDMRNSHKLVLLFDILRQCDTIGDKLLVFSQSLYSLDLIEHFLGKVDEATQEGRIDEKLGGHVGSWSPGIDYFRLDGSTSCENRSIWCKNFNREDNPRARLFLISTRAGGLGINLVAANRVVIFDVSWNPSHDVQSIFRVYRFGQKKPCYIYRFLAMGTMEEKIYERQVTKQAISKRVIDEQQIDRHYAENDLAELYKFEAKPPQPRPLPPLPKDRLFAEMLREHEAQIYKYHEHDSLLENKEEETLSEEERKAAWEDFENEKNRPPPAPFPSAWPMANGMVPNLLQQQQLAYAALAQMLRRDMPNVTDNQIRDMLPMIYNANPALMQKMNEIYKYAQPGMMNPAMMNPVMNPGAGGMSGSSGLQYEPPWQRQQQQQQQMRLQQLMQQQQNMGAKFYAGGLGSRDPVAMALQQQRAREIMVGDRGRARGRPPLQPRAPPAAHGAPHSGLTAALAAGLPGPLPTPSQDVVNLDSD